MSESWQALKTEPFDGINFYRNDDGDLEISGFQYKNAGEKVPGNSSGELYDISFFWKIHHKCRKNFRQS